MNYAITASKTQAQLHKFLGIFSPHFSKPKLRFLGQMLYGIQAAQDVKLSCIGRTLDEPISMKKLEDRLSRNLDEAGMDAIVRDCIAREGASHVTKDTFILVDPTDIRKLYARRMEYLDRIRDGSTGELGNGYWGCLAVGAEAGSRRITPLSRSPPAAASRTAETAIPPAQTTKAHPASAPPVWPPMPSATTARAAAPRGCGKKATRSCCSWRSP